ncbi:MAG TPA: hypothetical protein VGF25_19790 [Thermoleophilaceae bacterium]|jgi:hypothetical protein
MTREPTPITIAEPLDATTAESTPTAISTAPLPEVSLRALAQDTRRTAAARAAPEVEQIQRHLAELVERTRQALEETLALEPERQTLLDELGALKDLQTDPDQQRERELIGVERIRRCQQEGLETLEMFGNTTAMRKLLADVEGLTLQGIKACDAAVGKEEILRTALNQVVETPSQIRRKLERFKWASDEVAQRWQRRRHEAAQPAVLASNTVAPTKPERRQPRYAPSGINRDPESAWEQSR